LTPRFDSALILARPRRGGSQLQEDKIDAKALGDPDAAVWSDADARAWTCTDAARAQPRPISPRWSGLGRSAGSAGARALHNGSDRLPPRGRTPRANTITDNDAFPDGAALLFPLREGAPLMTMGSDEKPVAAWHWRADRPAHARSNVAQGLASRSSTRTRSPPPLLARRRCSVLAPARIGRRERSDPDRVGDTLQVAFAVWEGGNGERGGLKSFSPGWHPVTLEN
jgi:DMSO reductase family type II enzyme heme b subunit